MGSRSFRSRIAAEFVCSTLRATDLFELLHRSPVDCHERGICEGPDKEIETHFFREISAFRKRDGLCPLGSVSDVLIAFGTSLDRVCPFLAFECQGISVTLQEECGSFSFCGLRVLWYTVDTNRKAIGSFLLFHLYRQTDFGDN